MTSVKKDEQSSSYDGRDQSGHQVGDTTSRVCVCVGVCVCVAPTVFMVLVGQITDLPKLSVQEIYLEGQAADRRDCVRGGGDGAMESRMTREGKETRKREQGGERDATIC